MTSTSLPYDGDEVVGDTGISKACVRRLCRRAGIRRISPAMYPAVSKAVVFFVDKLFQKVGEENIDVRTLKMVNMSELAVARSRFFKCASLIMRRKKIKQIKRSISFWRAVEWRVVEMLKHSNLIASECSSRVTVLEKDVSLARFLRDEE